MSDDGRTSTGARRRIAIVTADGVELLRLRASLLAAIVSQGHSVRCFCARIGEAERHVLAQMGIAVSELEIDEERVLAFSDRTRIAALARQLGDWQPHVLLAIGQKPMVMAVLAAGGLKQSHIVLMPTTLAALASKPRADLGIAARWSLRRALKRASVIVASNAEDADALRRGGLLPAELPVHVLHGVGVDLEWLKPEPMPNLAGGMIFTMIARGAEAKGVAEFAEAAAEVKAQWPQARFILASTEPLRSAALDGGGSVVERTDLDDLGRSLAATHVLVHPAHGQGFANDAAAALACGRPVITADIAGCRETIDERVSGVLVPPHDARALARAMVSFLARPQDLAWMGQAARRKAERRFDVRDANTALLEIMGLTGRA